MVNSEEFIKKLEIILEYYSLNASAFADKIGVQRSSLSHLLSGRNKPSLDLILKIVESFPEVDLYWFLMNVGVFPKSDKKNIPDETSFHPTSELPENVEAILENTDPKKEAQTLTHLSNNNSAFTSDSDVESIVVFYVDGSFKKYKPK